jgi:chromosome segregation ATPase
MKKQLGIVILVVLCVGLLIALVVGKKQADTQRKKDADTILDFSNQLTTASASLDELRQVNLVLTNDLDASRQAFVTLSNQYIATSASLSNTKTTLKVAQTTLKVAQDQIADLEAQNQALDQRAAEMTNAIANLSAQIAETQLKLVKSETNNVFLENELIQQMAKKAELERKFNDLSQVRAQVRKLRDDLLVARRLEWARKGINPAKQQKGAQLLMTRTSATNGIIRQPGYNLNVEVGSEGSVKVVPAPTNTPAATHLWRW